MTEILLPEFIYHDKIGDIVDKYSILKVTESEILVSHTNTLNIYDVKTFELLNSISDNKIKRISSFSQIIDPNTLDKLYVIGYIDGIIKIFNDQNELLKRFRPHSKRVTEILSRDTFFISSSIDGSIIKYDIFEEEIKIWYKNINSKILGFHLEENKIYANCSDNVMKVWNIEDEDVCTMCAFNDEILDFVVYGNYAIVFFVNGCSEIVNLLTSDKKQFMSFKKIRSVKKFNDFLYLLVKKKLHVFKLVEGEKNLVLQNQDCLDISIDSFDLSVKNNNEIIFLSYENYIYQYNFKTKEKRNIKYHTSEIIEIFIVDSCVLTVSSNKVLFFKEIDDKLEKIKSIDFEFEAKCACILEDLILIVGGDEGLYFYDIEKEDKLLEIVGSFNFVSSYKNFIVAGFENNLIFYEILNIKNNKEPLLNDEITTELSKKNNSKMKNIDIDKAEKKLDVQLNSLKMKMSEIQLEKLQLDGIITSITVSNDGKLIAVGILDNNNVYIYDFKTKDLKLKLFGHSLPVTSISFSPDSKTLLTTSVDKLVKLWGADFGECRKSFVGNSKNAIFIADNVFMFSDSNGKESSIKYYLKHDLVKKYKIFDYGIIKYCEDFMVCSTKFGVKFFKIGEYTLEIDKVVQESSEIEEEIMVENKIGNTGQFLQFLNEIDRLENDESNLNNDLKYETLKKILLLIDLSEIDKFVYSLSSIQVKILVECVFESLESNLVVSARILVSIFKSHGYVFQNEENFFARFCKVKNELKNLRNEIGVNLASITFL